MWSGESNSGCQATDNIIADIPTTGVAISAGPKNLEKQRKIKKKRTAFNLTPSALALNGFVSEQRTKCNI